MKQFINDEDKEIEELEKDLWNQPTGSPNLNKPKNKSTMILQKETTSKKAIEIATPVFYKDINGKMKRFLALLNEQTCIQIGVWDDYVSVVNAAPNGISITASNIISAIEQWEQTTEDEFMYEYAKVIESLSLAPKLVEAPNPDDIKDI